MEDDDVRIGGGFGITLWDGMGLDQFTCRLHRPFDTGHSNIGVSPAPFPTSHSRHTVITCDTARISIPLRCLHADRITGARTTQYACSLLVTVFMHNAEAEARTQ